MLKSEKKAIRNTRLRYMLITSFIFLIILCMAIIYINFYYTERRKLGGYIETNQKVPELVKNNFNDDNLTGFPTQEKMFILTFIDEDNYVIHWGDENYHDFIVENSKKIYKKPTFINEFLISTVTVDNVSYYCGFDQSTTLITDQEAINKYIVITAAVYVGIVITLYFTSFIMLKPMKENIKMQNDFIANASHNLKTPISIIKSNAELIKEKGNNSEEIKIINQETNYMNLLIEDLLMLDNLSNNTKIALGEENISHLIEILLMSFDAVAYEKNINFSYEIKKDIIYKINKKDFKTLVNQLVNNAFKYVENERIVRVRLYKENKKIILDVYNTGCKVEQKDKDKMFQRFYRDKSTLSQENVKGSGIGLSIVKAIVDKYKYELKVDLITNKEFDVKIYL